MIEIEKLIIQILKNIRMQYRMTGHPISELEITIIETFL